MVTDLRARLSRSHLSGFLLAASAVLLIGLLLGLPALANPTSYAPPRGTGTGDVSAPAAQSTPTGTPQPVDQSHSESSHSGGVSLDSTPLFLTGSYYQWGYAKTCHGVSQPDPNQPYVCTGESDTFYASDQAVYHFYVLYNVTHGGTALYEFYRPDGTLHYSNTCEWADPPPGQSWVWTS